MLKPVHPAAPRPFPRKTPVDCVLEAFGAARASHLAGLTTEALRKWNRRRSTGGGGGLVPAPYQAIFLREAARLGLPLTADMLIAEPWE